MASEQLHGPGDGDRLDLVRTMVIEAGLEVLDRDGLGLRAESITYGRVFAYLADEFGVHLSRSSVHGRIWNSQHEFRTEVLSTAAAHTSAYERSANMHDAVVTILAGVDRFGLDRRQRVLAFSRIAGRALLSRYLESTSFRRFQAIKAAARAHDDAAVLLRPLVAANADGNREERIVRFTFMFDALGLRPRPELGLSKADAVDLFMTLNQILLAGSHLDHHAGFGLMASKVETDLPADEGSPWTYFGFAFLACIDALFDEDPGVQVPPPDGYPAAAEIAPLSPTARPPDLASLVTGKPRRTREELRELVVTAGVQLFLRDGLRLEAESLTYASVFAHLKATKGMTLHRSTVHQKIWSSQDDFRADVLAHAARYGTGESLTAMRQAMATQTVTRNPDGSVNVRQLILDNARATVEAQMSVAETSPTFNRWQLIKATMLSAQPGKSSETVAGAVNHRYEDMLTDMVETYRSVLPLVDLTVNPDLGMSDDQAYHLFAVICATLSTGSEYNIAAGAHLASRTFPLPRVDGSERCDQWPIPAIGSLAALDLVFVPGSGG